MYGNSPYGMVGGFSGGGFGGYNGMGGGYSGAGMNNMNNGNPAQPQMSETFQIVYGLLSGSQSVLSILGSFVDVAYFFKSIKALLFDSIVSLIKNLLKLIKYIITLRWIMDILLKSGELTKYYLVQSKYIGSMILFYKVSLGLGILICLYLKYSKTNQLKNVLEEEDRKDEEEENTKDNIEKENPKSLKQKESKNDRDSLEDNVHDETNLGSTNSSRDTSNPLVDEFSKENWKISEERWKK
eukprot:CAMPEP_0170518554 /NCGR_PEP_ID=MMETSP0209-20121228/4220_1 /TAXON_ID=665100 ORGANISM="Litonotus pictus, Strain P1" /NCGR_SAMPLE_ID=MMETSP0209 /ASSEMBLY_ACC=CAM_ASM_000301 /LENGTH=240 /DNA_ID=CAMNT_0010804157 /DNA_START=1 /DNA_END=723 /DNA_ORIENTATION=-